MRRKTTTVGDGKGEQGFLGTGLTAATAAREAASAIPCAVTNLHKTLLSSSQH